MKIQPNLGVIFLPIFDSVLEDDLNLVNLLLICIITNLFWPKDSNQFGFGFKLKINFY